MTRQAPLSMGFSRQEYWSGLPFPAPGDLPNPGIEPRSPTLQACSLPFEPPGKPTSLNFFPISLWHQSWWSEFLYSTLMQKLNLASGWDFEIFSVLEVVAVYPIHFPLFSSCKQSRDFFKVLAFWKGTVILWQTICLSFLPLQRLGSGQSSDSTSPLTSH